MPFLLPSKYAEAVKQCKAQTYKTRKPKETKLNCKWQNFNPTSTLSQAPCNTNIEISRLMSNTYVWSQLHWTLIIHLGFLIPSSLSVNNNQHVYTQPRLQAISPHTQNISKIALFEFCHQVAHRCINTALNLNKAVTKFSQSFHTSRVTWINN